MSVDKFLTAEQRETLNAAEQVLIDFLSNGGGNLMFSLHEGWENMSVTYFTPGGEQHGAFVNWTGNLACRIEQCGQFRADEKAREPDLRAIRIKRLQAELAELASIDADLIDGPAQ